MKKEIKMTVLDVKMIPIEKVISNDYNPNSVAPPEMKLLKKSIEEDGYTQPIVTFHDVENDIYIIVDGFHRYRCAKEYFNLKEIPVVVINKDIKERMASTIRHNRARGKHGIKSMSDIVLELIKLGWNDAEIAEQLGMSPEEVLRLKQITGLKKIIYLHNSRT